MRLIELGVPPLTERSWDSRMLSLVHSPNFGQARNRPGWPHLGSGKRTNASRCLEIMAGHLTSSLRDPLGGLKSIPRAVETKYQKLSGLKQQKLIV